MRPLQQRVGSVTQATSTTDAQETDGSDEADHDAQEVALGTAFSALLLAWLLPGPSSFSGPDAWDDQVAATIGPIVQGFLQRSAADVAMASGAPDASVTALQTAEQSYPGILEWIQGRLHDTLQNLTDAKPADTDLAQTVETAAENLARGAAVFAKSEVREQTVGKLGAVWKVWKTRHDDRVRPTHVGLADSKVPFGGHFVSESGAILRYPGDPKAPISETAGCRCHLNYKLGGDDFAEV